MMWLLGAVLEFLLGWPTGEPPIDERRQYAPDHNPGFNLEARRKTAQQHGIQI